VALSSEASNGAYGTPRGGFSGFNSRYFCAFGDWSNFTACILGSAGASFFRRSSFFGARTFFFGLCFPRLLGLALAAFVPFLRPRYWSFEPGAGVCVAGEGAEVKAFTVPQLYIFSPHLHSFYKK